MAVRKSPSSTPPDDSAAEEARSLYDAAMRSIDGLDHENFEWMQPTDPCGAGVVVIAGSSGALPIERARLLATHGLEVIALRWFGGPGQNPGPYEIELELFVHTLDTLASVVDRVSMLGASFGAEAALTVAARRPELASVVAISPTTHVWPGHDPEGRERSHWTMNGVALPHVPLAEAWVPESDPPAFRPWYELSLEVAPDPASARIPVEFIIGDVVLVAGGDDRVWPSDDWARSISGRRAGAGRSTTMVVHPEAGHRPILPGEGAPTAGQRMSRGGNPPADAQLGRRAWPHILDALGAAR